MGPHDVNRQPQACGVRSCCSEAVRIQLALPRAQKVGVTILQPGDRVDSVARCLRKLANLSDQMILLDI